MRPTAFKLDIGIAMGNAIGLGRSLIKASSLDKAT